MFPRALTGFARGLCTAAGAGKQLPRRSAETAVKKTSKAAAIAVGIVGAAGAGLGYTLYGEVPACSSPKRLGPPLRTCACVRGGWGSLALVGGGHVAALHFMTQTFMWLGEWCGRRLSGGVWVARSPELPWLLGWQTRHRSGYIVQCNHSAARRTHSHAVPCKRAPFGVSSDMKKTPGELFDHVKELVMSRFQEIADPDYTFMQNALGPPPPAPPDFDVPTIFLTVEGLLLHKEWDVRASVAHLGLSQASFVAMSFVDWEWGWLCVQCDGVRLGAAESLREGLHVACLALHAPQVLSERFVSPTPALLSRASASTALGT